MLQFFLILSAVYAMGMAAREYYDTSVIQLFSSNKYEKSK